MRDWREPGKKLIAEGKFEELRQLADEGGDVVAGRLYAHLLLLAGDETQLRERKEYRRLAELLARQERTDELRDLVDNQFPEAGDLLAGLLAEQGLLDELIQRSAAGNYSAHIEVVKHLVAQKDFDGLRALLPDYVAERELIKLLADERRYLEAVELQRVRARSWNNTTEDSTLDDLLSLAGLEKELRKRARKDDYARWYLTRLYARQGRLSAVRAMARTGDQKAWRILIELLEKQENVEELTKLADDGSRSAAYALVAVYRKQQRIDEIRAMARTGIANSRYRLAEMLRERGEIDELRALAVDPDAPAYRELVGWLVDQGHVDELEAMSQGGEVWAVAAVAGLAPERLWARAEAGDTTVIRQLERVYEKQQKVDELRRLASIDGQQAQEAFLALLGRLDLADELKARAEADELYAMRYWIDYLGRKGRVADLCVLADKDIPAAGMKLAEVLEEQGRFDELIARVQAGDRVAAWHLARMIAPPIDDNPENRLRP